jgi:hypothetical protein
MQSLIAPFYDRKVGKVQTVLWLPAADISEHLRNIGSAKKNAKGNVPFGILASAANRYQFRAREQAIGIWPSGCTFRTGQHLEPL